MQEISVENLENMIEGYANVFHEDSKVQVSIRLNPDFNEFSLDETFGNVAFKTSFEIQFSNPLNEEFLSAKILGVIKGSAMIETDPV